MTDTEKLDLLLEKVAKLESLPEKVAKLSKDMDDVKSDLKRLHKRVKQLHQDDRFILDKIERVHCILEQHISDRSVHLA